MSPDEKEEAETMIADCRARERKLTSWEADFLDSIEEQMKDKNFLSVKQSDTLNKIWEKCTS